LLATHGSPSSPLCRASSQYGYEGALRYVSPPPARPAPPDSTGMLLWVAVNAKAVEYVRALCRDMSGQWDVLNWANPGNNGYTPLHVANDNPQCTALLLSTPGIDVNKVDNDGQTPLWLAAYNGQPETVQALLAAPGIDVNRAPRGMSWSGMSPLTIAREMASKRAK